MEGIQVGDGTGNERDRSADGGKLEVNIAK